MPKRSELKLTKRAVDALDVEAKDALFWDRDLAGCGVRVHDTGRKIYVVQSRGTGGTKRVTLSRHGKLSVDEARKRAIRVTDRFFRTLKELLLWVQYFQSIPELIRALEEFRALYNHHWLIERLGFEPPVQARQRLALKPAA